jgi:hypothetical protein
LQDTPPGRVKALEVHFFKRVTGAYGGGRERANPELEQHG